MNMETLYKISYGMYVVSSFQDGKLNGQIANTVFQVTSAPVQIALCINKNNLTHDYILRSRAFSISILVQETPMTFIGQFGFKSGREIDKFRNVIYQIGQTGSPVAIENTLGYLDCRVVGNTMSTGTHELILGTPVDAQIIAPGEPMTYAYYHQVKKGFSPKSAPTYVKIENK